MSIAAAVACLAGTLAAAAETRATPARKSDQAKEANATVELFAGMRTTKERKAAEDAMSAMKLLGLNPKNAPLYGRLFAAHPGRRPMDLLVSGLCIESGLPLLTGRRKEFAGIRGLRLVSPRMITAGRSASDILNELGR